MSTLAIKPARPHKGSARATTARIAAVVAACLLVSFLVVQETRAAFSGQTDNPGNQFNTGSVALSDDDGGADAMFRTLATAGSLTANAEGMFPGQVVTNCIEVSYDGSITTNLDSVEVYTANAADPLGDWLNVSVDVGTVPPSGGSFDDCTGFVSATGGAGVGAGVLNTMSGPYGGGSTIDSGWVPTATGELQIFEIAVELDAAVPAGLQGAIANADIVWEIQTL